MRFRLSSFALAAAFVVLAGCSAAPASTPPAAAPAGEVNVYSGRHYDSDIAIYAAFTRETGIRVNVIEAGGEALIERIAREAEASPADVFITADAGMLWRAEQRGVFRPITDEKIFARAPERYRDRNGMWVGLSKRARIIVYNKEAGLPPSLDDYEDLASPDLKGQVCVRSSTNVYNQSLVAGMIARSGEEAARAFVKGVVANLARKPEGNDTTQIEAVAANECRISIVNSYYLARYLGSNDPKTRMIGEKVGFVFPNQEGSGAHVNISGAGVARYAPNPKNAEALISYLLSDGAQRDFAAGNNEYPVVEGVAATGPIAAFGDFRADDVAMDALGEHQQQALRILDEAGWL